MSNIHTYSDDNVDFNAPVATALVALRHAAMTALTFATAVIERRKFQRRFSRQAAMAVIEALLARVELRADPKDAAALTSDPGDDYLVALALDGGCEGIVTGDPHLSDQSLVAVIAPRTLADRLVAGE